MYYVSEIQIHYGNKLIVFYNCFNYSASDLNLRHQYLCIIPLFFDIYISTNCFLL